MLRWILVVSMIAFLGHNTLMEMGVPIDKAVAYTTQTVGAVTAWDKYDWTALGAMGLVAAYAWLRRPKFLKRGPRLYVTPALTVDSPQISAVAGQLRNAITVALEHIELKMTEGAAECWPILHETPKAIKRGAGYKRLKEAVNAKWGGAVRLEKPDKDGDCKATWAHKVNKLL